MISKKIENLQIVPYVDKNIKWMRLRDEPYELGLVIHDLEEV